MRIDSEAAAAADTVGVDVRQRDRSFSELDSGTDQRITTSMVEGNSEHVNFMSSRAVLGTFAALLFWLVIFTIVGSQGPERIVVKEQTDTSPMMQEDPIWNSAIEFHFDSPQFFMMDMVVRNQETYAVDVDLETVVKVRPAGPTTASEPSGT